MLIGESLMPPIWRRGRYFFSALAVLAVAMLRMGPAYAADPPKSLSLPPVNSAPANSLSTPLSPLTGLGLAGPQAAPAPASGQPASNSQVGAVGQPSATLAAPDPAVRAAYDKAFDESLDKPSDPDVLAKFAELAIQVGDVEGAISALERLLLLDGDQPDVKLELGVLYYRLGSTEAAKMYLDAARSSAEASNETKERASTFLQAAAGKK
jgi:Tetratricopeptide repeat